MWNKTEDLFWRLTLRAQAISDEVFKVRKPVRFFEIDHVWIVQAVTYILNFTACPDPLKRMKGLCFANLSEELNSYHHRHPVVTQHQIVLKMIH